MGFTESCAPVSTSDGNYGEFSENNSTADSSGDFFRTLHAETYVAVGVPDSNERLEPCTLTSTSLLLHWHDFHDFIFQLREEGVDDLVFLDGDREKVYLFHGFDFSFFDETSEF